MSGPLNGPLETGMRALAILASAFPKAFDLTSLSFLDYSLLHSEEFGGPASLHPDVPNHQSEIAVKRELLELGLEVMKRADLISLRFDHEGISYAATENAPGFVNLLESEYMRVLRERANWVVQTFGNEDPENLRGQLSRLARWPLPDGVDQP